MAGTIPTEIGLIGSTSLTELYFLIDFFFLKFLEKIIMMKKKKKDTYMQIH